MRRLQSVVAATVVAVAMVAAGCSGDQTSEPQQAPEAAGPPQFGGTLKMALGSEADGYLPWVNRWTPTSWMVAKSIFDPLAAVNDQGDAVPYLAESIIPNAEFTVWDIKVRSNITFHNGEPLNADAVVTSLTNQKAAALTSAVVAPVQTVTKVDELTTRVTMSSPWATFPQVLTGQVGIVVAPEQAASGDTRRPIGTGPFKYKNWQTDASFDVVRYDSYWQTDTNGQRLPYLDGVTFRPLPDSPTQYNAFKSGEVDLLSTADPTIVSSYLERGVERPSRSLTDVDGGDDVSVVFNTQTGDLSDVRLRKAAAAGLDRDTLNTAVYSGVPTLANGPFTQGSGWGESTTYPAYDPEEAKRLVNEWKADNGDRSPQIRLGVIPGGTAAQAAQFMQEAWKQAGFDVQIDPIAESAFALNLVTGKQDAMVFGFWYETDPDPLYHFLASSSVTPPGQISLNFARYSNPVIDQALKDGRSTTNKTQRQAAYQRLWDELGRQVPVLWINHIKWLVIWGDNVHDVGQAVLPDGSTAKPVAWGTFFLTRVWMSPRTS